MAEPEDERSLAQYVGEERGTLRRPGRPVRGHRGRSHARPRHRHQHGVEARRRDGGDLARFPSVKHFTSWLGLCPGTEISGGKVLGSATRRVPNRAAQESWPRWSEHGPSVFKWTLRDQATLAGLWAVPYGSPCHLKAL